MVRDGGISMQEYTPQIDWHFQHASCGVLASVVVLQ
jgi:hypothetical protein